LEFHSNECFISFSFYDFLQVNGLPPRARCSCKETLGDDEHCPITQHVAMGHRTDVGPNDITLLVALAQLSKTSHIMENCVRMFFELGNLPIILTRNLNPDVTRFKNSAKDYNKMMTTCTGNEPIHTNEDGSVYGKVHLKIFEDVHAWEDHINRKLDGVPLLIILFNAAKVKTLGIACGRICNKIGATDGKFAINITCDEGDLAVCKSEFNSENDKGLMRNCVPMVQPSAEDGRQVRHVRQSRQARRTEFGLDAIRAFFSSIYPATPEEVESANVNEFLREIGSLFTEAHTFTYVSATPLANVINDFKELRPDAKLQGYTVTVVEEYHGFQAQLEYQEGNISKDREIKLFKVPAGAAWSAAQADILEDDAARRLLVFTSATMRIDAQQSTAKKAGATYNNAARNKVSIQYVLYFVLCMSEFFNVLTTFPIFLILYRKKRLRASRGTERVRESRSMGPMRPSSRT